MFKVIRSATALSLLLSSVDARPHVRSMHDSTSIDVVNTGKKMVKEVHGFWGADYMVSNVKRDDNFPLSDEDRDFRFEVGVDADLGLGYEGLVFWIVRE